jgi:hypothetical protein
MNGSRDTPEEGGGLVTRGLLERALTFAQNVPLIELIHYRGEGRRDRYHPNGYPCHRPISPSP